MRKVRIGVIGTGMVTQVRHLPELSSNKNVEVVALCSRTSERASSVGEKYGIKNIYSGDNGWQELIQRNDLDGVVVSVPNYLHAKISCAALREKKHVLIEKPIATSLKEADEMVDAAKQNKVILMVAHNQRFVPCFAMTKTLMGKELLGKVHIIDMVLGHSGPESWVPEYWSSRSNWFFAPEQAGGGAFLDIGIHAADLLLWLVGKKVTRVQGFVQTLQRKVTLDDCGVCSMEFEDGTLGNFQASWIFRPARKKVTVSCEKGTIKVDAKLENPLTVYTTEPIESEFVWKIPKQSIDKARIYSGVVDHFVECIQQGKEPLTTGREARDALEVILAGYKSAKEGTTVDLPLKA